MGKRARGSSVNLDSFLDIMTCMLGILVLIILLTGIDASQIKVLIPTPMMHATTLKPIYIECRNNEMFTVPVTELRGMANDSLKTLAAEAKGDSATLLSKLAEANVQNDTYRVDLTYALLGQFAIWPVPTAKGYAMKSIKDETDKDWYGKILTALDKEKEMVTFLVRDNSFEVFKKARGLAWAWKVEVSYELLDAEEPIKFGLGGSRSLAQ